MDGHVQQKQPWATGHLFPLSRARYRFGTIEFASRHGASHRGSNADGDTGRGSDRHRRYDQGGNLTAAASQNARQASAVIDALRTATGPGATIETVSYIVTPDIQPTREDGNARITGYTATNIVRVTGAVAQVGHIIDAALKAGANRIHRINFTLKDEQAAGAEALRAAVDNARSGAETLADALGVKIVRVLSATTGQQPIVRPFVATMLHEAEARASTPIHPSTVDVRAIVTLTLEIEGSGGRGESVR